MLVDGSWVPLVEGGLVMVSTLPALVVEAAY
jgi:hypothetical protein